MDVILVLLPMTPTSFYYMIMDAGDDILIPINGSLFLYLYRDNNSLVIIYIKMNNG